MTDQTAREEWLAEIRKAAAARDRAEETYGRKLARVRALIRGANDSGVPMTEIARAAGIGRERAHRIYAKAGPPVD